ncbi:PadR family transcriptional regulator [Cytobacillus oceanisediminis]|uniref:helix-turn-helix transcriptional regulator n=1 Tax=Cytobacillus oceanisediminis TaxID=665099 RepID=UPI00203E2205|nr:helix-turn-helix transcriptional regulator [Cytobacillus oceanisediminis]MCM3241651.1 PadR family transcriptional regulator [Cytobacillus oceanisediminis]
MSIEHTILAVLSFWPSTGYNIKSEFEHKAAGLYWGMSYGSIYPKLKKLEEEGFIYAIEQEDEGRKKKMYELTAKGWKEFENWLKIPPSFPVIKDELLMKMSTWHEDMDNEVLISHLLKRKEETSDILKFVQEWPPNGYSYVSKLGCLSIRYAEMKLETEIKWIEESIEALQNNNLPDGQDPHGNTEKLLNRRRRAIGGDKGNCQ